MKKKRDKLRKAVLETYSPTLEKLEKSVEDAPVHEFSPEFESRIEKAFEARKKHGRIYYFLRRSHDITMINVVAAAVVLFFCTSIVQKIDAFNIPFIGVTLELFDSYAVVRIDESDWNDMEKPQTVETLYEPSSMIKGYNRSDVVIKSNSYLIKYKNKKEQTITYCQHFMRALLSSTIELERYKKLEEKGITYYYIPSAKKNTLIWIDDKYQYELIGNISLKKLKKIATELIKVE